MYDYNNNDWNNPPQNIPSQNANFEIIPVSDNSEQFFYKETVVKPRGKGRKLAKYLSLVLVTSLVTSAAVGGAMYSSFSKEINSLKQTVSLSSVGSTITDGTQMSTSVSAPSGKNLGYSGELSVSEIAKKAGKSIVGIKMDVKNRQSSIWGNDSSSGSEGSGIIISKDGYIMTNYHVVQYADKKYNSYNTTLTVYLPDKREAKATFIGGDSENDLAVIKINLNNLPVAELGDSSSIEVGDLAVAIGNPLGMEFAGSVTSGVISALNRQLDTGDATLNLIQTDAAINPGNSGGALLNANGQVIGINSAKISVTGVEGLGFSIPINTAKPIIEQLIKYGYVTGKPLIGISAQEVSEDVSRMYGIPVGAYIVEVTPGGAAEKAGIKKGDVLIKLDGQDIKTMSDIDAVKKTHKAGDTVKAIVSRNGSKVTLSVKFTEQKQ